MALAGLTILGLQMVLSGRPAWADDPPDPRQRLQQLQNQLNHQRAEINRLKGELEQTRRTEAACGGRLSHADPPLGRVPRSDSAPAESGGAGPPPPRAGRSAREDLAGAIATYLQAHPSPPAAGYERGFFIRNPDGPQIFYVNTKFQDWFDAIASNPRNPPLGSSPLTPRQNSGDDTIRFQRAQLHFSGNLTDHLGWKIMIDPALALGVDETQPQTTRILQDIFITYTPYPWLGFKFGQCQAPMTMEGFWQTPGSIDFPLETLMARSFGVFRDTGLQVSGKPFGGIIEYYAGVFSGARENRLRDENSPKDLREWLAIHPLARSIAERRRAYTLALKQDPACRPEEPGWKELMIGMSRRDGVEGSELFGRYHGDATNVFGDLEYGRFITRAEWSAGRGLDANLVRFDPNPVRRNELLTRQAYGWYVTLGYNLTEKWQAVVRHEEYSRDRNEPRNLVRITTLGLNYYLFGYDDYNRLGDHRMEIQTAYNFEHSPPNAHYFVGNELTISFQIAF